MTGHAAVVLAAGQASRYRAAGGRQPTKLLEVIDDAPLVRHVVMAALGSAADPVILVTGHASEAVARAVADLSVTRVHNAAYAEGLASSLRAGIAAVPPSCAGVVVLLADMPGIRSDLINALIARALDQPGAGAVVPTCNGRRGNPVLLGRALLPAVTRLAGDVGARHLLRDPALQVAEVPWHDAGILNDVDLPEQVAPFASHAGRKAPFTLR